jgi:hypothetical protein
MKILHLTLKKKWFDMIASGEKTEEYREIKPFWISRLQAWGNAYDPCRDFNAIRFYNGWACSEKYANITLESKGIEVGEGKPEWGAEPNKEYYIIKLGKIIEQK